MLGNNFSDYEDNYPRIAPSPIALLPQQASTQPNSSVPEVSLIFTNANRKLVPSTLSYPSHSIGPSPPKGSVPELSIILPNNNDAKENIRFSNNANSAKYKTNFKNNEQCSLPIKTFTIFKEEYDKKMASNAILSKTSIENNNYSKSSTQISENSVNFSKSINKNDVANLFSDMEVKQKESDLISENSKTEVEDIESVTGNICHCKYSNSEDISKKIDNLVNLIKKVSDDVKEIHNEFENFKLEMKSELMQTLTEVISKQLTSKQKQDKCIMTETTNYGKEITMETDDNVSYNANRILCRQFSKVNILEKPENLDVLDIKIPKKQNINGRANKKQIVYNVLDPLPENSPLVICSDRSFVMQRLAEKYLPENYYRNIVINRETKINENLEILNDKHVNDLSFASYDYLKKYNLISENHNHIKDKLSTETENYSHENMMLFGNIEKEPKFL